MPEGGRKRKNCISPFLGWKEHAHSADWTFLVVTSHTVPLPFTLYPPTPPPPTIGSVIAYHSLPTHAAMNPLTCPSLEDGISTPFFLPSDRMIPAYYLPSRKGNSSPYRHFCQILPSPWILTPSSQFLLDLPPVEKENLGGKKRRSLPPPPHTYRSHWVGFLCTRSTMCAPHQKEEFPVEEGRKEKSLTL